MCEVPFAFSGTLAWEHLPGWGRDLEMVEDFGDVLVTRDGGEVLDVSAGKAAASVQGFMTSHEFKGV